MLYKYDQCNKDDFIYPESNKKTAPRVVQVDPDTQVKHVHLGDDFNISCIFYVGIPSEIDPLGFNVSKLQ